LRGAGVLNVGARRKSNRGDNPFRRDIALVLQPHAIHSLAADHDLLRAANVGRQDGRLIRCQHVRVDGARNGQRFAENFLAAHGLWRGRRDIAKRHAN
jgi:hypothetical protein